MASRTFTPEQRELAFAAKWEPTENGCWQWTGARTSGGYGQFWTGVRVEHAHRWAWRLFVADDLGSLVLDHLCCNRACVNPDHLEPVTNGENIRRGYEAKGQTHCKRGHDLSQTARVTKSGSRDCRLCDVIRRQEASEEKKAARRKYAREWARKKAASERGAK